MYKISKGKIQLKMNLTIATSTTITTKPQKNTIKKKTKKILTLVGKGERENRVNPLLT